MQASPSFQDRQEDGQLDQDAAAVVEFWDAAGPQRWFRKDEAFDHTLRQRFGTLHERAASGALDAWAVSAEGALALLILLDQFPRNAFRGSSRMYGTDAHARRIAHQAIAAGLDLQVPERLRRFMYLPLMHSEDLQDQELCSRKTQALGDETHRYALHHADIVRRFGRFPHRNTLLGRVSTPQEERFMAAGGFSG